MHTPDGVEEVLLDAVVVLGAADCECEPMCAATRHEQMGAIVMHAVRFGLWIVVFMGIVLCLIQFLSWLQ